MGVPGNANALLLRSAAAAGGYQVSRSLRFNSSDSAYLSRTPASAGNRKTWTWAGWVKRSSIGQQYADIFNAVDTGSVQDTIGFNYDKFFYYAPAIGFIRTSTAVYRDCSAWYHFVFCLDTTNATAQNRFRLWVNGSEVTTWQDNLTITQNVDLNVNKNSLHLIGAASGYTQPFDGYLADVHFIDGQALTPSSFTEVSATTGQLIPKAYTGSFGTNGFWLQFADNSNNTATTLGKDTSGNGNNWTPTNFSVTAGAGNDSLVDTPTSYGTDAGNGGEVRGNYCTWNPLDKASVVTLSNGNLDSTSTSAGEDKVRGTIQIPSTGSWYFEVTIGANIAGYVGIASSSAGLTGGGGAKSYGYNETGRFYVDGGNQGVLFASFNTNDVVGVKVTDNSTITFYKNGTQTGSPQSIDSSYRYFPMLNQYSMSVSANFGQRPWAYPANASGAKALCDTNLPAPVVAKPNTVMDTVLWTGNDTGQTITLPGAFSPDLVWTKMRSAANAHWLFDVIRGANQGLSSSSTTNELTRTNSVTAFGSTGFTLGTSADVNSSAYTYVAWCWDAGSSTVTNTQGSITSSVRANTSAGFSIVTWTGTGSGSRTIGHGGLVNLDKGMIIVKDRSLSRQWNVYHGALGATKGMVLNSTFDGGNYNDSGYWNNTAPTSTVFTVGVYVNEASNYVAYCFAPVAGYSSFGLYDAGTDPFVYLGFRPAMIIFKRSNGAENWNIVDNRRNAVGDANVVTYSLQPNSSGAEYQSEPGIDLLSNGFKLRGSFNSAGGQYIYAAWAASPFQYARAR